MYDFHAATWRARDEDEKALASAPEQQPALCQAAAEQGAGQPRFDFAIKDGRAEVEQPLLPPEPAKVGMLALQDALTSCLLLIVKLQLVFQY